MDQKRHEVRNRLLVSMRKLTWCFILAIGPLALMLLGSASQVFDLIFAPAYIVSVVFTWMFFFTLGRTAALLKRSWTTWVGLALVTSPIGPVVAYFYMRSIVRRETAVAA